MTMPTAVAPLPRRMSVAGWFLVILIAGLALRLALAYVVFPSQGFASDLEQFRSWSTNLAQSGAGSFYQDTGANYPPGYLYILWLLGELGGPLGSLLGVSASAATLLLLKLPAIAADAAIAVLLYHVATSWFGGRAGLVAAALYLFVPVTWYDSALWGQVDAVGSLLMLAALVALTDGWSEPATVLAVLSVLVKPQDAVCLVVVVPVLVRRHLLRVGTGPQPDLGARMAAADARLGGLFLEQGPIRLATSLALGALVGIVLLLPFDIESLAPASLSTVPVIGHVAGLISLFGSAAGQFDVLTANAFNGWALVGPNPLSSIAGSGGTWTPDSLTVIAGLTAVQLGAAVLVLVGLLVIGGLLLRDGRLPIFLAFAVTAFAFYAVPTRVHERYLFAFFPVGALLAAGFLGGWLVYLVTGALNAVNLHAVLGSSNQIGGFPAGSGGFGGGSGASGFGEGVRGGFGGGGFGGSVSWMNLPFVDLARSEPVVVAVALSQTVAFAVLLIAWLVVAFGPLLRDRMVMEPGTA
jgi:dolichyl-phosphate-mannose-protein mannosyltransferase